MATEPMFQILNDPIIKAIPWAAIAPHSAQAQRNHSQTLAGLDRRGGLSVCEAVAVMTGAPWKKLNQTWARAKLMCLVLDFERTSTPTNPTPDKGEQQ